MFFAILGFFLVAAVDLTPLLRKRRWKDVAAWLIVLVPAVAIAVLLEMKVTVPSSMVLLGEALKAVGLSY